MDFPSFFHVIALVNKTFCFSDADNICLVKAEPSLNKPVTGTPPVPSPGTTQSAVTEKEGTTNMLLVSHTLVAERLPSVVAGKVVLIQQNGCNTFQFRIIIHGLY